MSGNSQGSGWEVRAREKDSPSCSLVSTGQCLPVSNGVKRDITPWGARENTHSLGEGEKSSGWGPSEWNQKSKEKCLWHMGGPTNPRRSASYHQEGSMFSSLRRGKWQGGPHGVYPAMEPCALPHRLAKALTRDTSSRMSPKVAARSVRSSLTCLETSSLWVISSPASKRAWFQRRAEEPVRIRRKRRPNEPPPSSSCHPGTSGGWAGGRGFATHHHGLEDLCGDGGQHALVVVLPDAGEDAGELAGDRPKEDTQGDVDIL